MAEHPRVLFVSTSIGAGHNQAAAAIQAALRQSCPRIESEFVDALEVARWWFRLYYSKGDMILLTRLPWLYEYGYRLTNKPSGLRRAPSERMRLWLERRGLRPFHDWLLQRRPALIVATHYLVTPLIGRLIEQGVDGLRMVSVCTDNDAHRWWYAEHTEHYFVANERVPAELAPWGVPAERITVSGIPIHPKWTMPLDRQRILAEWKLPVDKPIVILSGGTFFTLGPIERVARGILDTTDAHVVVLASWNKQLLADLAKFPEAGTRLTPVPFTDKAHELAEVAAIMVTKAGGLTTAECIAKGLGIVLTKSLPGQERSNSELLSRAGAALLAPEADDVVRTVARLLSNPVELAKLRANGRRLYRPGTDVIVARLREMLGV